MSRKQKSLIANTLFLFLRKKTSILKVMIGFGITFIVAFQTYRAIFIPDNEAIVVLKLFLNKEQDYIMHKEPVRKVCPQEDLPVNVIEDEKTDPKMFGKCRKLNVTQKQLDKLSDVTKNIRSINNKSYEFHTENADFCNFDLKNVYFINGVIGKGSDFLYRSEIRSCWQHIKWTHLMNYKIIFIIGFSSSTETNQKIEQEINQYGDIVLVNVPETQIHDLSLALIYWTKTKCSSAKWIIQSSSDTFLNLFHLRRILKQIDHRGNEMKILCADPQLQKIWMERNGDSSDIKLFYCSPHFIAMKSNFVVSASAFCYPNNTLALGAEDAFLSGIVPLVTEEPVEMICLKEDLVGVVEEGVPPSHFALLFNEALRNEFKPNVHKYTDLNPT